MGSALKNITVVGSLIAVAAAGYYLIVIERDAVIDSNNAYVVGQADQETQEFLRRLNELQAIDLSTTLFSDVRFNSFVDFTEPVEPVPFGRDNPFAQQ